jgi:adenylate cyclase class IV
MRTKTLVTLTVLLLIRKCKKNTRKLPQEFMYYKELEDTKGVIRIRISKTDRQYNSQAFEDTKGVIRIRISKKNRQHIWML